MSLNASGAPLCPRRLLLLPMEIYVGSKSVWKLEGGRDRGGAIHDSESGRGCDSESVRQ